MSIIIVIYKHKKYAIKIAIGFHKSEIKKKLKAFSELFATRKACVHHLQAQPALLHCCRLFVCSMGMVFVA